MAAFEFFLTFYILSLTTRAGVANTKPRDDINNPVAAVMTPTVLVVSSHYNTFLRDIQLAATGSRKRHELIRVRFQITKAPLVGTAIFVNSESLPCWKATIFTLAL